MSAIAHLIRANLPASDLRASWDLIEEFNWDQFVRKLPAADYVQSRWALGRVSANGYLGEPRYRSIVLEHSARRLMGSG